jgi:hypothetical protein
MALLHLECFNLERRQDTRPKPRVQASGVNPPAKLAFSRSRKKSRRAGVCGCFGGFVPLG